MKKREKGALHKITSLEANFGKATSTPKRIGYLLNTFVTTVYLLITCPFSSNLTAILNKSQKIP